MTFKAKVKQNSDTYHFWRKTDHAGLFVAICNPGLTRATTELFDIRGSEVLCKVCQQHQGIVKDHAENAYSGRKTPDKNMMQLIELIQVMFGAINDHIDALEKRSGVNHED